VSDRNQGRTNSIQSTSDNKSSQSSNRSNGPQENTTLHFASSRREKTEESRKAAKTPSISKTSDSSFSNL